MYLFYSYSGKVVSLAIHVNHYFIYLKIVFHCLLISIVIIEKPALNIIFFLSFGSDVSFL